MEFLNRHALASAWVALQGATDDSALQSDSQWSAIQLNMMCIEDPEQAWRVVVEIFEFSSDPWVLENLGAGPVETLLSLHGQFALNALESYMSEKRAFLGVLAHVWRDALSPEVAQGLMSLTKRR